MVALAVVLAEETEDHIVVSSYLSFSPLPHLIKFCSILERAWTEQHFLIHLYTRGSIRWR